MSSDGIERGPNGLTDQGIETLRAYVKEHGDVPPEYAATLVDASPFGPEDPADPSRPA